MNRAQTEQAYARKSRIVGLAIAATVVVWYLGTTLVAGMGGQARFVFLIDLAALAAFVWIFVNIWRLLQLRRALNSEELR
ncbi:DUF5337 domain-containing protein [Pseudooceanicola sp. C21-150M6]|uniref:DUF5337 domain-containing protein n=1 Tax=Pseudooceanicola sp. C21-150M6 TaxID=3434355 RepID=UPI003D7F7397